MSEVSRDTPRGLRHQAGANCPQAQRLIHGPVGTVEGGCWRRPREGQQTAALQGLADEPGPACGNHAGPQPRTLLQVKITTCLADGDDNLHQLDGRRGGKPPARVHPGQRVNARETLDLSEALDLQGDFSGSHNRLCDPGFRSRCLIQTECELMDQLAFGFAGTERQGLNESVRAVTHPQSGKVLEPEPSIVAGSSVPVRPIFSASLGLTEGSRSTMRRFSDPLVRAAKPGRQQGPSGPQAGLDPDPAFDAAK